MIERKQVPIKELQGEELYNFCSRTTCDLCPLKVGEDYVGELSIPTPICYHSLNLEQLKKIEEGLCVEVVINGK